MFIIFSIRKEGFKFNLHWFWNSESFISGVLSLKTLVFMGVFKVKVVSSGSVRVFTITINTVYFHCIYCKHSLKLLAYKPILHKILTKEDPEYRFHLSLLGVLILRLARHFISN